MVLSAFPHCFDFVLWSIPLLPCKRKVDEKFFKASRFSTIFIWTNTEIIAGPWQIHDVQSFVAAWDHNIDAIRASHTVHGTNVGWLSSHQQHIDSGRVANCSDTWRGSTRVPQGIPKGPQSNDKLFNFIIFSHTDFHRDRMYNVSFDNFPLPTHITPNMTQTIKEFFKPAPSDFSTDEKSCN